MMTADMEYEDIVVADVESETNWYVVRRDDGWVFGLEKSEVDAAGGVPVPGERMRLWGRGIGHPIRGVAVWRDDGLVVFRYESEAAYAQRMADEAAERDEQARAVFEAERAERDAAIAALPEPLRARMRHFQEIGGPSFRWRHEPYEVFVCQQAAVFAETLETEVAMRTFRGLPYDEQRQLVPGMSDDHTGNTFDCACALAAAMLAGQSVVSDYGALHGSCREGGE